MRAFILWVERDDFGIRFFHNIFSQYKALDQNMGNAAFYFRISLQPWL